MPSACLIGLNSFNPYRVFKFVATRWNAPNHHQSPFRFNPYRVFKFVATCCIAVSPSGRPSFNPYRVFKFVATVQLPGTETHSWRVSIPIGFSSSLQQKENRYGHLHTDEFQSLSGFQVRCNVDLLAGHYALHKVSIPIGFSSSLQHLRLLPTGR